jgi:hypothetical protein
MDMVPRIHGCHVAFRKRGPGPGLFKGEFVSPGSPRPAPLGAAPAGEPLAEAKPKKLLGFDAIGPSSAAPGRGGDPPAIPTPNLKCRRRRRRGRGHECDALAPLPPVLNPRAAGLTGLSNAGEDRRRFELRWRNGKSFLKENVVQTPMRRRAERIPAQTGIPARTRHTTRAYHRAARRERVGRAFPPTRVAHILDRIPGLVWARRAPAKF